MGDPIERVVVWGLIRKANIIGVVELRLALFNHGGSYFNSIFILLLYWWEWNYTEARREAQTRTRITIETITMIVRRGGVDFLRFFPLSCFSAVYSSHILSDSIHNMVLLGENSIVDMDMGMSACLLLSCLKRVLICKDIYRLCGAALLHGISRLGSSCPFLLITFGVLPLW